MKLNMNLETDLKTRVMIYILAVILFFSPTLNFCLPDEQAAEFLKEVNLTEGGLLHFFKCYNSPYYTKRFLPSCFLHVTDLLAYIKNQDDPYAFAYSIFSLFLQKSNECTWINPFAFGQFLEQLPPLFDTTLSNHEPIEKIHIEEYINETLPLLDRDEDTDRSLFVSTLSDKLYNAILTHEAVHDLQSIMVRFLEKCIDKLIWDPKDDILVWKSFQAIGNHLKTFYEKGLIADTQTLNELIKALISRFCYVIDICGANLKIEWYQKVRDDLNATEFLQIEESEKLIKTKMQTFMHGLNMSEARARAYEHGVIV